MTEPVGLARGLTNYGDPDFALYLRRSFARSMGYSTDLLARPVIGIADTFSDFNNCHRHFPELIAAVKRGVLAMGGLPLTFPTISLGEVFLSPTGRAAMQIAKSGLTPDRIVTPQSVDNALRVLMAIGGSTNAVLHLTAVAGRAGVDIGLDRLNRISDTTPVLVDLKPTGPHYMED